ncbi:unnamed protein product [Linum trigynum]|uniref:Uncharacterized protein n=1 Tax=Linum trigynum TaxID=586398 RepID=A0AAV2EC72_9ROSI
MKRRHSARVFRNFGSGKVEPAQGTVLAELVPRTEQRRLLVAGRRFTFCFADQLVEGLMHFHIPFSLELIEVRSAICHSSIKMTISRRDRIWRGSFVKYLVPGSNIVTTLSLRGASSHSGSSPCIKTKIVNKGDNESKHSLFGVSCRRFQIERSDKAKCLSQSLHECKCSIWLKYIVSQVLHQISIHLHGVQCSSSLSSRKMLS